MKSNKKSTMLTILAVIISMISLVSCFGLLRVSNSYQGISIQEKEEWNVGIENVSKLAGNSECIEVFREPVVNRLNINYGVNLNKASGTSQFEFTLKNKGNVDAVVSEIRISGIEGYEDYVSVSCSELEVGEVLKQGSSKQVRVLTNYFLQYVNEEFYPQVINLENINIEIKLEKVE